MTTISIEELSGAKAPADEAAMEQFAKKWTTYQKLVDNNGLSHREVAAELHKAVAAMPAPFGFFDIACGDAGQVKSVMAGTAIARYRGIDLSAPALRLAARNLAGAPFQVRLEHGDFVEALQRREAQDDIAWCGLSMHHLETQQKRRAFADLRATTRSFALIYEPTLRDGEDRKGYLRRFAEVNRSAWSFFSDAEWDELYGHVSACDLPETSATWRALGREAGFSKAEELFCDAAGFHRLYRYEV